MAKRKAGEEVVMGIDPGTNVTGYGIVAGKGNDMRLLGYGIIDMRRIKGEHGDKLKKIFDRTCSLIQEFRPDYFAVEAPFHGKNVQSMLKLGRAQGVAIAAALRYGLPVTDYAPKKVKMALTGNGAASKEMVMGMVENLLSIRFGEEDDKFTHDASDGLAVALCHFLQKDKAARLGGGSKSKGWGSFLAENPDRIRKR